MLPDTVFQRDQSDIADGFVEGHYLHYRRGYVALPVRVWWGCPPDLENGGEMDRSPRWNIELAGVLLGDERSVRPMDQFENVWPKALGSPVTASETRYRQARIEHAREHDPQDPFGDRFGRVDLMTAPPGF